MNLYAKLAVWEDCDILYNWVNDIDVRNNAFNNKPVAYESHKKWFYERLNSPFTKIFIVYLDEMPIGQLRIDIVNDDGIISYSIDSKMRGRGYGSAVLDLLPQLVQLYDIKITRLVGKVKPYNEASKRSFIKAGYHEFVHEVYIEYFMGIEDFSQQT